MLVALHCRNDLDAQNISFGGANALAAHPAAIFCQAYGLAAQASATEVPLFVRFLQKKTI